MTLNSTTIYAFVMPDGVTRRPCLCVNHDDPAQTGSSGDFQVFLDSATSEQGLGTGGQYFAQGISYAQYDEVNHVGTPNSWCSN